MANFKKTGDLYVDKSNPNASDANAGTDPDLPKLTIQGALDVAVGGNVIIVADGLYSEFDLSVGVSVTLEGDGITIFEGDGVGNLTTTVATISLSNIIVINYNLVVRAKNLSHDDVIYINCFDIGDIGGAGSNTYNRCRFVNTNSKVDIRQVHNYCIFTGSSQLELRRISQLKNTILTGNSSLNCIDEDSATNSNFCNVEIPVTINGVLYNSLSDAQSAVSGAFLNSINTPTLLNRVTGEIETLDFSVEGSSLCIGAGENGTSLGNVKRGISSTRFSDSVQNGTITNLVFDGQTWRVQNGFTIGTLESDVIDFGLTVKSPKPNIKGTINYLDNVPDFDNLLRDPNKCDFEVRYAIIGEDISAKAYKPFLYNEQLLLDNTGKSTGEDGFDWNNTVTIPMKQVQYRATLRQDFNA